MKIIVFSLLFLFLTSAQLSAQKHDEQSHGVDLDMTKSNEEADSVDEIIIMRFQRDQAPQLVELTNPVDKLIVANISDSQMARRLSPRFSIEQIFISKVGKLLKAAGIAIAKAACAELHYF